MDAIDRTLLTTAALWTLLAHPVGAPAETQVAAGGGGTTEVSFRRDIAPILIKKCQTCHGPEKSKGKYRLDTFELAMKAGGSGDAPVAPGKPEASKLFQLITAKDEDDRMPQKDDPLPAAQIQLIANWIKAGAHFDGGDPQATLANIATRREHPDPPELYLHAVPVTALAFHPGGQELAVGGYHEVTIWNPADGRLLRRIRKVARQIQGLAYTPDGGRLAAAGGAPGESGEVALLDPAKGARTQVLATMPDVVMAVAISPDGHQLAAGGADNSIHLYDLATGKEMLLIQQHADWVMALAFNADGSRIASASRDRTARVYETKRGELQVSFTGHDSPVYAVAFGADGKSVISGGRDKKLYVWSASDGTKTTEIGGFEGDIFKVMAGGQWWFTAGADKLVRQYQATDRKLVRTFEGHTDWVYSLAIDPSRHRLAAGSYNGDVRLWNLEDGRPTITFTAAPGFKAAR